jgi:hypothetical protein
VASRPEQEPVQADPSSPGIKEAAVKLFQGRAGC